MKKIILCFVVLVLVYIGINSFNNYKREKNFGDKSVSFNEKTILGEKLVLKNNTVDYDNYYVISFFNGNYIIHNYCYLNNREEYLDVYRELSNVIVDYNYNDLMIRSVLGTGNLSYYDFYLEYTDLFNNNSLSVIY